MANNLQELLDETGNPVDLLRNSRLGTYIYPVVPAEFTNWRREQKAWRETAAAYAAGIDPTGADLDVLTDAAAVARPEPQ